MSANIMALAHVFADKIVKLLNIAFDDYFYIYTKERKTYTLKAGTRPPKAYWSAAEGCERAVECGSGRASAIIAWRAVI